MGVKETWRETMDYFNDVSILDGFVRFRNYKFFSGNKQWKMDLEQGWLNIIVPEHCSENNGNLLRMLSFEIYEGNTSKFHTG